MRILMVNKFLYAKGGAETYFLRLGETLKAQGHEVQYFGMADEHNSVFNQAGLYVSAKDFHQKGAARLLYPFSIIYSLEARRKIGAVIDAFKPDVVHLNNINYQLTPSVIDGAVERGVKVVQTVHDTQMLCPSHMMLNLSDLTICEKCVNHSKINCIRQRCVHGSLGKSVLGAMEGTLYAHTSTYRKVARYVCPSRFMEQMLLKDSRFTGRTCVLQNFIELPEELAYQKQGYVLYFGRLSVEKGIDRLMEATRLLPHVPFVIAGSGPEEDKVRASAPENVRFVGFQTGAALRRLIGEANLSVYLPILYENCPMSVLESVSLGTPVVANRIGGIPELLENGKTGVLLNQFTPEAYAEAIDGLWSNPARLEEMRGACLENRSRMITLERYAEEMTKLYERVLAG